MYETIDTSNRQGNRFSDLTGENFGRLTVVGLSPRKSGRKSYWVCRCECGEMHLARSDSLKDGSIISCGCVKKEQDRINLTKHHRHKESKTRLYHKWQGMKARCESADARYGGRGIRVCDEWVDSYECFRDWALASGYRADLTIERINVNGNYEPSNCTWIPPAEQANNRRTTVWVDWNGKKQNLKQWANEIGLNYGTVNQRYRHGWRPPELLRPVY